MKSKIFFHASCHSGFVLVFSASESLPIRRSLQKLNLAFGNRKRFTSAGLLRTFRRAQRLKVLTRLSNVAKRDPATIFVFDQGEKPEAPNQSKATIK